MINENRLLIIWDEQIVGTLTRHKRGTMVFQYSQDWLNRSGRPISLSLPCRKEKYSPGISTAFFENLLPENNARSILSFNRRFDKKDTFAFLENFGEDCAGALSIIPEGSKADFSPGQYECINTELTDALDKVMADPGKYTLFPEMKNARLSIAGAQDKLPVYLENGQFYLPETSGSATTHIVNIMIFNYLIGNHDAHGKNFSIIHEQEIRSAPFYDLLSTQVYPSLDNKFAMAIGQTFRLDRIKAHSFRKFARDMNIRPRKIAALMDEMIQSAGTVYESLLTEHERKYGHSKIYDDLFRIIQGNLDQLSGLKDALAGN
ncbi:MAG: type II toxin-antitoxin system HipA family toxin [Deltaproteobacteria bacterium]|nr:type II toxin-antitoxin system HipA family toxin [Deltaproteobacteria bacterium]